jgi:DNA-binding NtrC family response regulator
MSTILIIDPNGRRRVAFEAVAQAADHKVYSAGSAKEALVQIEIYVPEAVVIASDLPDKSAVGLVKALRASDRGQLRAIPIATPVGPAAQAAQPNGVWAKGTAPATLLAAALDAIQSATEIGETGETKEMKSTETPPTTEEPSRV